MRPLLAVALVLLLPGCGLIQLSQPSSSELVARRGFDWRTDSTAQFAFYYEAHSPAEQRLDQIKRDAEASLAHILELLDVQSYDRPLHLFLVSSRERMRQLVGRETNGTAFFRTGVLAFIISEDQTLSARHELLHVVAMNLWGVPEPWLNEGLAVYASGRWHGYELHALAHHLDDQAHLIPLDELVDRFRRHDDLIAYPEAGSLVKHVYERHGLETVRTLWARGVSAMMEATGGSLAALEAEWLTVVRAVDGGGIEYPVP